MPSICLHYPPDEYHDVGVQRRQVTEIIITKTIIECQAQIVCNSKGKTFTAPFPRGITHQAQYGLSIKLNAIYMAIFQLIPYDRLQQHFNEPYGIQLSTGTLYNFLELAHKRLAGFDVAAKWTLIAGELTHADETRINIGGKRLWLHNASNTHWTLMFPHEKRGNIAMNKINILPHFNCVLCHDYWQPYSTYLTVMHSLYNAHHLRELLRAYEQDDQTWANEMHQFLVALNTEETKA